MDCMYSLDIYVAPSSTMHTNPTCVHTLSQDMVKQKGGFPPLNRRTHGERFILILNRLVLVSRHTENNFDVPPRGSGFINLSL